MKFPAIRETELFDRRTARMNRNVVPLAIRAISLGCSIAAASNTHSQELCAGREDQRSHGECVAAVMAPMEERLTRLYADLEGRFVNEAKIELKESERAWNAYRHHQCYVESVAALPANTLPDFHSQKIFCGLRVSTDRSALGRTG